MAYVPPIILQRWRSRNLVGNAKHQLVVRVRKGSMVKSYQDFTMLDGSRAQLPIIWKGNNTQPWQGVWTPAGPWITVPEIESAKTTKDFTSNSGSSSCTVIADDVAFLTTSGTAGVYHTIQRGYFSPQRGYKVAALPSLWAKNEWSDVLNGGYQIEIWEGYGPDGDPSVTPLDEPVEQVIDGQRVMSCAPPNAAISRTWTGLIETCELDSHPDMITITARDFGIFLTDQRVIFHNKAPEIPSPLIVADRRQVLGETNAGYGAFASGSHSDYTPGGVLPTPADGAGWVSEKLDTIDGTAYIGITLPAGAYDQIFLSTAAPSQRAYVVVDAVAGTRWDGQEVNGKIDNGQGTIGYTGIGDHIPYTTSFAVKQGGSRYALGGELQAVEGTKIYVFLTHLNNNLWDPVTGIETSTPGYVASVHRLWAYRYGTTASAPVPTATGVGSTTKAQGWVLVDDVTDIVKMVLVWAGFHEWSIESMGWSLAQPFNFGQDQYFMDVITSVMNQGDWLFYMKGPTDDDLSIGIPTFRQQSAVTTVQPEVAFATTDQDTLEGLQVTYDKSDLPYSFRVRGAINPNGATFGQDLSKRYQGTYFPPWSGLDYAKVSPSTPITAGQGHLLDQRLSGLNRAYVATQGQVIKLSLNSTAECVWSAVLTAVQYALQAASAQFQVPGLPNGSSVAGGGGQIELNGCATVIDEGSGTHSRVWISSIESNHTMGENGSWHMTISGSLLDTEDLQYITEDWAWVVFKYGMEKGAS